MVLGMFMAVLDIQIVAASLTQIQAGLSASPSEVSWVQTSYLIAEVVMIPLSGYLARMMSTRVLFTISAAGFTISSLLCGMASSMEEMMIFRAIQGFIGGAMIPTTFATSFLVFGIKRRSMASAFVGLTVTLAPTIGPTLGGYITDTIGWHWIFFVNVIPGIIVTTVVWLVMDIDRPDWRLWHNLDVPGLAFLAIFLGTFQYVLEEGPKNEWFRDAEIRNLAATSLIAGIGFFWRALTRELPVVDLSPFKSRAFATSTLLAFMVGVGLFGITYLLPLYLGRIRGYSSMQIGETLWVSGLFMFMTAPTMGFLAPRVDLRILAAIGFVFLAVSSWLLSDLTAESTYWDLFIPQALRGMGLMTTMMGVQTIAIQALSPQQVKGASGLFNLLRNTGGAFGLAVLNTGLVDRTNHHWERLREGLQAGDPAITSFLEGLAAHYAQSHPGGDPETAALKILGQITFRESSILAFNDLFVLLAVGFVVVMGLILTLGKPVNRLAQEMH
jgi:DHA2 family multidrug resistance protein